jgi:hypothetical protein
MNKSNRTIAQNSRGMIVTKRKRNMVVVLATVEKQSPSGRSQVNLLVIANALLASEVPALGHERASVGGLEPASDQGEAQPLAGAGLRMTSMAVGLTA